jgi:hypothetical protein
MAGLAAVAATIAINLRSTHRFEVPLAILEYGPVHYDIRAVNDSSGLGGFPAYCANPGRDLLQIVYSVQNRSDHDMSAAALPRVVIIDQNGTTHYPDTTLSDALSKKVNPPLIVPHGRLAAGDSVILADVFVTARDATRFYAYRLRPAPGAAQSYPLPLTKLAAATECVRQSGAATLFPEDNQ